MDVIIKIGGSPGGQNVPSHSNLHGIHSISTAPRTDNIHLQRHRFEYMGFHWRLPAHTRSRGFLSHINVIWTQEVQVGGHCPLHPSRYLAGTGRQQYNAWDFIHTSAKWHECEYWRIFRVTAQIYFIGKIATRYC